MHFVAEDTDFCTKYDLCHYDVVKSNGLIFYYKKPNRMGFFLLTLNIFKIMLF